MPVDHILKTDATVQARIAPWSTNGEPTYGAATPIKGIFQEVDQEIRDKELQLIHIDGTLWVSPKVTVNTNDLITVNGTSYRVVKKTSPEDVAGRVDHHELFLIEY